MNSHDLDLPNSRGLGRALQDVEAWLEVESKRLLEGGTNYAFPGGFLELFDMWFTLDYVLHEKDPAYDKNDDNYLYSIRRPLSQIGGLLDDLKTHSGLAPEDIGRIGDLFVDLIYVGKHCSDRLTASADTEMRTAVTTLIWNPEDRYYNSRRFRDAYIRRIESEVSRHGFDNLTPLAKAHCNRINSVLKKIEWDLSKAGCPLAEILNERLESPDDHLDDYEIEPEIDYILADTDPVHPGGILFRQSGGHIPKHASEHIEAIESMTIDYAESLMLEPGHKPHCYLFHDLYDHCYLDWQDLPRIDRIDIRVEVWLQRFINLADYSENETS